MKNSYAITLGIFALGAVMALAYQGYAAVGWDLLLGRFPLCG